MHAYYKKRYAEKRETYMAKSLEYHAAHPSYRIRRHLKKLYGLTLEQYEGMVAEQGGCCALCGQVETSRNPVGEIRRLSVDHNHTTGALRGLLCNACNRGLGYFDENRTRFLAAVDYLARYEPQIRVMK